MSRQSEGDVRMRGFVSRETVETAVAWVEAATKPGPTERVPLDQAWGRTLAGDVVADMNVPGFDRSAMDGYAVRSGETIGAGDYNPVPFRVVGEALPGRACEVTVHPGEAVRIMTGAPLPDGADAVVPAEYARQENETVELTLPVGQWKHVGRVGEDIAAGNVVLHSGRRLRPQDLGVLASLGQDRVEVWKRPRVGILVTGNELVRPGQPRGEHQIYEANSAILRPLVERDGGALARVDFVDDDRDAIAAALTKGDVDVVLVSGGSSVGAEDHAPGLLAELGELAVHGIAMRPSSPTGMGRIGETVVFLLPGNPVSCLCAYDFFAGRAIRRLGGRPGEWPYRSLQAPLTRKISSAIGRVDYCRVRRTDAGIEPLALSGASILSSTTRADGFVVVPAGSEGAPPGTMVDVWLYD
ncbi:Molybdopterin molybdenumtransferase [Maioricimonas rarisocia]|uniref:Molybdopterin molybdenumtransferase n=1 Tax=Maioricimonas rarisocia TaxID=2528026 RepID=A0A517ZCU2_9PLAN|nr:gephyrin-like molybdotransferase Glp [Maioricimonas rarisocia]QDU40285.1 Molybdopterin molybdenumtransferase [Maioricimonas rarisocia]